MSTIGSSIPSSYINLSAPQVPPGRQPVSLESDDLKTSSFKSLEQPAASGQGQNRRAAEENPGDLARAEIAAADSNQREQAAAAGDRQQQQKAAQQEQLLQDQAEIAELAARDREVRAHERAHAAVGGQYAGSPTYEFAKGPDGVNYAVSGEVSISMGAVAGDPEATILKAQQIRAAANAPAEPSGADRAVAAAADKMEAQARLELDQRRTGEIQEQERRQEEDLKLRKAEEARRVAEERELREEEREKRIAEENRQADATEQERAAQRRAERIEGYYQLNSKTFDINRHLVDIGV